jgi:hypothetical protein
MVELLLVALAMAEVTAGAGPTDPVDGDDIPVIVVEGRRSAHDWDLPKLEYGEPASCPALVETDIPGFGAVRIRKRCASDGTEEWRLFQY